MSKFLIILLLCSFNIWPSPPFPKKISCFGKVTKILDKFGVVEKWLPFPNGVGGIIPNFGTIEIHQYPKATLLLAKTDKSVMQFSMTEPKCEEKISQSEVTTGFSDLDLSRLLTKNPQGGLIYIWSPHMELSVQEASQLSKIGLKTPFTVILDPKADINLAKEVAQKNNLPAEYLIPLDSQALYRADITIHYPAIVFYKNGRLRKRIPGYNGKALIELTKAMLK